MAALWIAGRSLQGFESLLAIVMLGWIPLFGWIVLAPDRQHRGLAALAGIWALAPTWLALARLYLQADHGSELVVFVLVLAWAADIGAYFAGRYFGRLRLAPKVSPNKTWEGVLGGLVTGSLVAMAGTAWFELPPLAFLSLCIAAVLVSVVGDLVESMFKRQRGMKDSGSLLPGHGGVLDRIDSLTSSVPLLALGFCWLGARDMRGLVVLGSTGSIGENTLDVAMRHRDRFRIVALAARANDETLAAQCLRCRPAYAAMLDRAAGLRLQERLAAAALRNARPCRTGGAGDRRDTAGGGTGDGRHRRCRRPCADARCRCGREAAAAREQGIAGTRRCAADRNGAQVRRADPADRQRTQCGFPVPASRLRAGPAAARRQAHPV